MSLFEAFEAASNNRVQIILNRAAQYCEYGETYFRDIASPANRLKSAIERGHTGKMLDWLADELESRLDHWEPILAKSRNC